MSSGEKGTTEYNRVRNKNLTIINYEKDTCKNC